MKHSMRHLVESFPTLRRGTDPKLLEPRFDARRFAERWATGSGGERDAALFVLSVWNPGDDWSQFGLTRPSSTGMGTDCGFFDLHTALGNWDEAHRAAFVAWCAAPWWP